MEKILPYSRDQITQDTYYWCGPASTQTVVRAASGRLIAERDLAARMGTTVNGTNSVYNIVPVLRAELPKADYTAVAMPNDPPTAAQKDRLWRDIKGSIDAGYGVVANIVAPPSNYPQGVNGSVSPRYAGGTVYHYIAIMGYKDDGQRAVWVADSGFAPYGYWCAFEQMATLIPPKGYIYAAVKVGTSAPPPPKPTSGQYFDVDWSQRFKFGSKRPVSAIKGVCIHTTENDASASAEQVANYQISSESGSYHVLVDSTAKRLRENTDDWKTWSTGNLGNDILLHLAFVARASWTRAQWLAQDRMLRAGASVVAHWCRAHSIPVRWVQAAGLPGTTTHDATRVWGGTDHTDPGPGFPHDVFLRYVNEALSGKPAPSPAQKPVPNPDPTNSPDNQEVAGMTVMADIRAQLTGSPTTGYPGWQSRRWQHAGKKEGPAFTAVDYLREVDREVNSLFDYRQVPDAAITTLIGHVCSTRRAVDELAAKIDALAPQVSPLVFSNPLSMIGATTDGN